MLLSVYFAQIVDKVITGIMLA